ncbi:hypothetical protein [Marinobacter salicampi]|uniref:hypothetical protein n=1 Tax=Marinobacter salicampi TaxID=435907 RepID=UPI00140E24E4|nr:hypothetical protein [Marinobacter salicampi]
MFTSKHESQLAIEKEKTAKALSLAMIDKSDPSTIRTVTTASNVKAVIHLSLIKSVIQEEKGWYYNDPERDTLLIHYLDGTWVRLEMRVEDFASQTGLNA